MKIHLLFITYNRLDYTKLALASVLGDPTEEFSLTIWDNASTDGTAEYLKNELNDPRIVDVVLSKENVGQVHAVNEVWGNSKADLIGKLDNDCLVTPGWTRKIAQAHRDIENLGIAGCWRFPLDEFNEQAARKAGKIQTFGEHQMLRHPWVAGSTFLMKRSTFESVGSMVGKATTKYAIRVALAGYINGFYFPLIFQEHMDDPRSEHCKIADDEGIRKHRDVTFVLREHNITSMEDRWRRRQQIINNLNSGPWQAKAYMGWRGKIRRGVQKIRNIRMPKSRK
ncbi:MAG: glycosyltransferase [Planctomycetes bacterium]|nr:glycosyltransferase [Planctomycetota bacterium]